MTGVQTCALPILKDTEFMIKAVKKFYETAIVTDEEGRYSLGGKITRK